MPQRSGFLSAAWPAPSRHRPNTPATRTAWRRCGRAATALGNTIRQHSSGRSATLQALHAGLEFDAVFAHNDVMAGAAMGVLRDAGRRIPDDVAVVGFDDLPVTTRTEPPLTAVRQPVYEMGEAAARALLRRLGPNPPGDDPIVIPTTLSVRASTVGQPAHQ